MPSVKTISSQAAIKPVIERLHQHKADPDRLWGLLEAEILMHRVKFPVLEYLAKNLDRGLDQEALVKLMEQMAKARHISCYPVIGKLLQLRLTTDFHNTYDQAIAHIIEGNEWYSCDIIGERVFGEGTLVNFEQSLERLRQMGQHDDFWIQRAIGIATHYATKKGLAKEKVEQLLQLMMVHAHKTQYFTKKGVGWAGKTIAKYHPDLIRKHEAALKASPLSRWFITKLNIGLSMAGAPPFVYE